MWSRLTVAVLGLFWAFMTLLLWRNEYGDSEFSSNPLPSQLVWQKILTSPDSSSLAIIHRGERIGFCHLISSVADQYDTLSATNSPEGLVRSIQGYKLDFSGSLSLLDESAQMRLDGHMTFSQNQRWENFQLQITARPTIIDLRANREEGLLRVRADGTDFSLNRQLRLDQLGNPQVAFTQLLGPAGFFVTEALPFEIGASQSKERTQALHWKAATDRMHVGGTSTHVYRLELTPMDGLSMVMLVSRAGEILKVELPDDVVLINEALTGL